MTEQFQTTHGNAGNCLEACAATIMDVDLSVVAWLGRRGWWGKLQRLCRLHGWQIDYFDGEPRSGIGIASGPTERGLLPHSVVWQDGQMVFDPHPLGAGLLRVEHWIAFKRTTGKGE